MYVEELCVEIYVEKPLDLVYIAGEALRPPPRPLMNKFLLNTESIPQGERIVFQNEPNHVCSKMSLLPC